jgi:hypothetical protein
MQPEDPEEYVSFLVRVWPDQPVNGRRTGWRGEIEHIQSGRRWCFATLGGLLVFLHRAVLAPQPVTQPEADEPAV